MRSAPTMRAHRGGRQIVLADVHAGGASQPRDVGAIVDDDSARRAPSRQRDERVGRRAASAPDRVFRAELKKARAAVETRARPSSSSVQPARVARVGVENGVERRD